jgi:hypothetical protein
LSIFLTAFLIAFTKSCNSSIDGAGAIASQERFPEAECGRGGSILGGYGGGGHSGGFSHRIPKDPKKEVITLFYYFYYYLFLKR